MFIITVYQYTCKLNIVMFIIEPQSVVDYYFDLWATQAVLSSASKPCLDAFPIFIAGIFAYIPALCLIS